MSNLKIRMTHIKNTLIIVSSVSADNGIKLIFGLNINGSGILKFLLSEFLKSFKQICVGQ